MRKERETECLRVCFDVICDGIPPSVSKNPESGARRRRTGEEEEEEEARGLVHEPSLRNARGCRWRFQTNGYLEVSLIPARQRLFLLPLFPISPPLIGPRLTSQPRGIAWYVLEG